MYEVSDKSKQRHERTRAIDEFSKVRAETLTEKLTTCLKVTDKAVSSSKRPICVFLEHSTSQLVPATLTHVCISRANIRAMGAV
jgi:hypothetical protein